jgi:predicted permease
MEWVGVFVGVYVAYLYALLPWVVLLPEHKRILKRNGFQTLRMLPGSKRLLRFAPSPCMWH